MTYQKRKSDQGYSVLEILIVISIIFIMTAASFLYLNSNQILFRPDTQSLQIVDIFQEARQRSLTQRETMRVEINMATNIIRLIDENDNDGDAVEDADDDVVIKSLSLFPSNEIKVDAKPLNITSDPPEIIPAPPAVFTLSVYPDSISQRVCTVRFVNNGQVLNAGNNPTGTGATMTGLTLFVWSPDQEDPNKADLARAITIIGTTGSVRFWEYDPKLATANKWKDSRRSSGYGL